MRNSKDSRIYIAGHKGMVGSACWRILKSKGYTRLIGKSSFELDLRDKNEVNKFISEEKPTVIINAAAKVGGILANNNFPFEFLLENMQIQNNLIECAYKNGIEKFVFLGSTCIYPKFANQPILEESLLTSSLEETNQWYAIAKISGVKLIEALNIQYNKKYISLMPTNLYGPNDNYSLNNSHVIPGMIMKFHEAKINNSKNVKLWGTGSPLREFLYVDDLANAIVHVLENDLNESLINVGSGIEISIKELAELIKKITSFQGSIIWDDTKPDGTPRKLSDSSKLRKHGWTHQTQLEEGLKLSYTNYLNNIL